MCTQLCLWCNKVKELDIELDTKYMTLAHSMKSEKGANKAFGVRTHETMQIRPTAHIWYVAINVSHNRHILRVF